MLKKRIIPILLYEKFGIVKNKNFTEKRMVGAAAQYINLFNSRNIDELIFIDILATKKNMSPRYDIIKFLFKDFSYPLTIGGGIKKVQQAEKLLMVGADKIAINSEIFNNLNLIKELVLNFGSQFVVCSIDIKKENDKYKIYDYQTNKTINQNLNEHIKKLEDIGAGELLITSVDKEGQMNGADEELISLLPTTKIPIIFAGGCGKPEHFEILENENISAIGAGSIFFFTRYTPNDIKEHLKTKNVNVRI